MRRIDFEIQTSFIIPAKLARVGVGGRHVTIATALVGWGRSGALGRNAVSVLLLLFSSLHPFPPFHSIFLPFLCSVRCSFFPIYDLELPPSHLFPSSISASSHRVPSSSGFISSSFSENSLLPHPRVFVLFRVSYPTYFHISVSEI